MRGAALLLTLLLLALSVGNSAQRPSKPYKRKIPCKTPENAASCYWTHGRLASYNGTPAFRLWKIGTGRMLGIYSGPGAAKRDPLDNEHPELPENVQRNFKTLYDRIFADFEVCPLEPERDGAMQAACIESAKNIIVDRR